MLVSGGLINEWMETKRGQLLSITLVQNHCDTKPLKFSVDFSSDFLQKNPVETLEICPTDSLNMKGIHTWGRKSMLCVTSGEWSDIWKFWVESASEPVFDTRWQIHPEGTQLHGLQEVWLDGPISHLWRWGLILD